MKISVIIPAYNAAKTIEETLKSVFHQTYQPTEILVYDDGSTDGTASILDKYRPNITVFRESNQGVAHARNVLCSRAKGDVLAFLDADDVWHPSYLEYQSKSLRQYDSFVASFTYHEDFVGYGRYRWHDPKLIEKDVIFISPTEFIKQYNSAPMRFQMSCCCIPRYVLSKIGKTPFCVSKAEDTYFHNSLPLYGSVLYIPMALVAYRITEGSLSVNRMEISKLIVDAFKLLDQLYKINADQKMYSVFKLAHASRKRTCGKFMMGVNDLSAARAEFCESANISKHIISVAKSIGLYLLSYMPKTIQPKWPNSRRQTISSK
jgi:glycosyltransferase involved in cell wall biosynthesis